MQVRLSPVSVSLKKCCAPVPCLPASAAFMQLTCTRTTGPRMHRAVSRAKRGASVPGAMETPGRRGEACQSRAVNTGCARTEGVGSDRKK
ncbi:hypothetical protein NDU88_006008 [Pleurodeles waltl]|uniref:Secreted protein n=1 Tax=Pleurodeles waltl TaxID=8319 RepID=A0AAV7L4Q3_PLEWA|nr:hypothetical protein NDU88_006008 [Pleurodeles waltl]